MKKILLLLVVLVSSVTFAQNNGITYQAVIYSTTGESVPGIKNSNSPLANKAICLQFSIGDGNSSTEYQEKVIVTTDDFGMVNLVIGTGTQTGGFASSFNAISWASSQKYLKVSVDQSGNCSSFELISNQILTYVPYALAANSAASVTGVVGIANGGTNATTVVGAKTNLLLQNVDNTTDLNKPLSTATQTALATKVDKVSGKELSSNDYTTVEKTKLAAITGTNTGDQDLSLYATNTNLALKANTESPSLSGIPTAPTAALATNTTQLATTEFVNTAITGNFVDVTTNQTIAGNKTFSSDIVINGIKVGNGGGSQSTIIGDSANATQANNTALGFMTLDGNSGTDNTAVGTNSMKNSQATSYNTAIGENSGTGVNTGNNNTYLGYNANVTSNSSISNATAIGAGATVTSSDTIQLGADGTNGTTAISNVNTSGSYTGSGFKTPTGTAAEFLKADGSVDSATYLTAAGTATNVSGVVAVANGGTGTTNVNGIQTLLGLQSNNVAIGSEAGSINQSTSSIAIGGAAGRTNQSAGAIGIGYVSGDLNQGSSSIAIGPNAAQANQSNQSIAIGFAAGQNNQGQDAIAIGTFAGQSNQAANSIAINAAGTTSPLDPAYAGFYVDPIRSAAQTNSLFYNTSTKEITYGSSSGNFVDLTTNQTIAGKKTFSADVSVNGLTIGKGTGQNGDNTAIGAGALNSSNSSGTRNTAVGASALLNYEGTSFDNNTGVGYYNMVGLTTGGGNTSVGAETMFNLASGSNNTGIGNQSLISITGNNNVGVGNRSGDGLTTGSNNTFLGTQAKTTSFGTAISNATAIGYEATVESDNTMQLGNTDLTSVKTSGALTTGNITYPTSAGTAGQVLTADGSGAATWVSAKSESNSIICKIADAPNTILSVGGFEFRYNSSTDGGFIEVRSSGNDNMMVFCQKNSGSWELGGATSSRNYRANTFVYSPWTPVISLATGQTWSDRVTISIYESFEATMFSMGNGDAIPNPLKSYKIFAAIDGYFQVFLKVDYTIK